MEVLLAEVDEDGRIMCVHRLLTFSYKRESTKPKIFILLPKRISIQSK